MSFRLIDFTKDDLYDVGIPAIEEQNQNVSLFLDFEKKQNMRLVTNFLQRSIENMTEDIKAPRTFIFADLAAYGESHLVQDTIEDFYWKLFEYIIIIYPMLCWNKTCCSKPWTHSYKYVCQNWPFKVVIVVITYDCLHSPIRLYQ